MSTTFRREKRDCSAVAGSFFSNTSQTGRPQVALDANADEQVGLRHELVRAL